MNALRWWQFGLIGGLTLSLAMLAKVVGAIPRFFAEGVPWSELAIVPLAIFGMGFACGLVVWVARFLSTWLGRVGDALIGIIVMNVFFLLCMLIFDRPILLGEHPGAGWILGVASVTGMVGGAWLGHDFRREQRTVGCESEGTDSGGRRA